MHKGLRPIIHEIAAQRSELFHWAPVFIGLGIAVTFHFGWIIGVLRFVVVASLGLFFLYRGHRTSLIMSIALLDATIDYASHRGGGQPLRSYMIGGRRVLIHIQGLALLAGCFGGPFRRR